MPAKPDVVEDELEPWTSDTLAARFELTGALVSGAFAEARAPGGRVLRSRLDRVVLTGSRLRMLSRAAGITVEDG